MSEQAFIAAIMATSAGLGALLLAVLRWAFERLKRRSISDDDLPLRSRTSVITALERSINHGKETKKMVEDIQRQTAPIAKMAEQTDDLHKWHDQRDEDGVPLWYVRKSLERAIGKMTDAVDQQTAVLNQLVTKLG